MIITSLKPLDEIFGSLAPYTKVLIAGCDGCTQPPRGIREAQTLAKLLELGGQTKGKKFDFKTVTVAKQCDTHLVATMLKPQTEGMEVVLSLACGLGPQTITQVIPEIVSFPAQNSIFTGIEARNEGSFEEWCSTCGDCILALTGGICPVTRCSKGLLNAACGGARNEKCEQDSQKDCAWCLIYKRLKALGKLDVLKEFRPPRPYRAFARPGRYSE